MGIEGLSHLISFGSFQYSWHLVLAKKSSVDMQRMIIFGISSFLDTSKSTLDISNFSDRYHNPEQDLNLDLQVCSYLNFEQPLKPLGHHGRLALHTIPHIFIYT